MHRLSAMMFKSGPGERQSSEFNLLKDARKASESVYCEDPKDSTPVLCLYNNLEDVDRLKAGLRQASPRTPPLETGSPDPYSPTNSLTSVTSSRSSTSTLQSGHELSLSLPTLLDKVTGTRASGGDGGAAYRSLDDLSPRADGRAEYPITHNGVANKSAGIHLPFSAEQARGRDDLIDTSQQPHSADFDQKRLVDERIPERVVGLQCVSQNSIDNTSSVCPGSMDDDYAVRVDQPNGSLSTVLENIPLVYIPNTRQLVRYKHSPRDASAGPPGSLDASLEVDERCSLNPAGEDCDVTVTASNHSPAGQAGDSTLLLDCERRYAELALDSDSAFEPSPRNSLKRTNTSGSLSRTDASSFSSISSISTNTDFSVNASISDEYNLELRGPPGPPGYGVDSPDDDPYMELNLHSRNSYEHTVSNDKDACDVSARKGATKTKWRGLGGFFSRGLFSRKAKTDGAPGWRLFGRALPKNCSPSSEEIGQILEEARPKGQYSFKKTDIEVTSTTALILENRPMNLPSKSPEEELRHRQEYEAMIEAAKRKEIKEAKLKKKHLRQQIRAEDRLSSAAHSWNTEILPCWDSMRSSKKAQDLWWLGIPPCVRGKVWQLAIGNHLNLTHELYEICLNRAKDRIETMASSSGDTDSFSDEPSSSKEDSVELIKLDVARTFPQLCIFQKGGPYYDLLHSLLGAYACYRPDVGYVQGMSFIAAVLLLNMEVANAFVCFANLLNKPCQVAFFRVDESIMKLYFETFEEVFKENLPLLFAHFQEQELTPDIYIIDWIFTLFSKSLPLDVASRVWDVFCRDGEEFLFRTALGILKVYEDILLKLDFIHLAQFLTKLCENSLSGDELFRTIETIQMTVDNKKFSRLLSMRTKDRKDNRDTGSIRSFKVNST